MLIINLSLNIKSNLYILSNIISQLPNYKDNASAVLGGVPLWGFYRTGGVLKIRLNDVPPNIMLIGSNTINISYGIMYIDPGVVASSIIDGQIIPNLISIIDNNNNNILVNTIPINGPTIISNLLPVDQYILTYKATDNAGNYTTIIRNLIVSSGP